MHVFGSHNFRHAGSVIIHLFCTTGTLSVTTTIFRQKMRLFAFYGLAVATLGFVKGLSATGFTARFATVDMAMIAGATKTKEAMTPATTYAD